MSLGCSLLTTQITQIAKNYANQSTITTNEDGTVEYNYSGYNWTQDPEVMFLKLQDNELDNQQNVLETQLKAFQESMEKLEKGKESDIKNGIAKLA